MLSRLWVRKPVAPICRRFVSAVQESDRNDDANDHEEGMEKDVKYSIVDELGRAYGTGRRKTSVARVWLWPGSGQFLVNKKCVTEYFQPMQREQCILPFSQTSTSGLFDVKCTVKGGGISGQAGAVRLGVSRALVNYHPELKPELRRAGLMTRDSRRVERKKPGQKKARKQYQWVKR